MGGRTHFSPVVVFMERGAGPGTRLASRWRVKRRLSGRLKIIIFFSLLFGGDDVRVKHHRFNNCSFGEGE